MKRLTSYFIGSALIFLAILSVFNLELFLEFANSSARGLAAINGESFLDELYADLWRAFGAIGALFLLHFVATALIAWVYRLCWREPVVEVDGSESRLETEKSRNLSPFFAAAFALIVLLPLLCAQLGKSIDATRRLISDRVARPLAEIALEREPDEPPPLSSKGASDDSAPTRP